MLKQGENAEVADIIIQAVAGENLAIRDAVYIKTSDGKAYKCDADDVTTIGFAGFVVEAKNTGETVNIRHDGNMNGFSGLTVNAPYYLSATAGAITATPPTNFKQVGIAISASVIKVATYNTKRVRVYTTIATLGESNTRFDVTNPAGTTFRYTWDGTGTDPVINSGTVPIGSVVDIQGQNLSAGNKGVFVTTGVGSNYFEITNASGVAENDKTLGTGYLNLGYTWTKPGGLKYIEVELVGGGLGGQGTSASDGKAPGGPSGAYSREKIEASALSATESVTVGHTSTDASGRNAGNSRFGSYLSGGGATTTGPGTASGGDINIDGQYGGGAVVNITSGKGGDTPLGFGGAELSGGDTNGRNGTGYGSGGGGSANSGAGSTTGGNGAPGVVIVTEYY